jgi:hypothetical protein
MANVWDNLEDAGKALFGKLSKGFEEEKAAIAGDVRSAVTAAEGVLAADKPEILAALKQGAQAVEAAVEAALKARGL